MTFSVCSVSSFLLSSFDAGWRETWFRVHPAATMVIVSCQKQRQARPHHSTAVSLCTQKSFGAHEIDKLKSVTDTLTNEDRGTWVARGNWQNFSALLVARTRQSLESRVRGAFLQGAGLFRVWFRIVPGANNRAWARVSEAGI